MKRAFSSDGTWSWSTAGLRPGTYTVHVWANQAGDQTAALESMAASTVTLTGCTSATLAPGTVSQPAGSTVNLSAGSAGCPNPVYEYWVQFPNGRWYLKRAFSTDGTWAWDTTGLAPGRYVVHAWANQQGAYTGLLEAVGSSTVTLTGCTSASLSPATGTVKVGTPVTFTASSAGCPNPVYEFWLQDTLGHWHLMRGFGAATWTWSNVGWGRGTYHIHVWANQQGAYAGTYERLAASTFTLS
jgi:trimeric autotransporter adhesin